MCLEDEPSVLVAMAQGYLRLLQEDPNPDDGSNVICCPYKGVLIYITGAVLMAAGVNLQKFSLNQEKKKEECDRRRLFKQPFWVIGLLAYASSGALLSLALAFAKQSQLAPLMSVVIVSNALFARFLLFEPITLKDLGAIIVIICAVILSTVFAPSSENVLQDADGLIALYQEPGFVVFLILLIGLLTLLYVRNRLTMFKIAPEPSSATKIVNNLCGKKKTRVEGEGYTNASSSMGAAGLPEAKVSRMEANLFAFSFGAQAGVWGGLSVTMMKSGISIIIEGFNEDGIMGVLGQPLMYGLLLVLVCCWVMQLYWISAGLERFPAVFVVSIEAVLNELVAVFGGILYFKEYEDFTLSSAVLFSCGVLLGVAGIMVFAARDNGQITAEDDVLTCCCPLPLETEEDDEPKDFAEVDEIREKAGVEEIPTI